jgi:hypothetical protein
MSYIAEFKTVDLVLTSKSATSGVDAFALSLIKAERQMRKLVTYLVFQSRVLTVSDIPWLIKTLAANRRVYFNGAVAGFDALSPTAVKDLIGPEYERLWAQFCDFAGVRNKIFHGQLTGTDMTTGQLRTSVNNIKLWCHLLAENAIREIGYDGFERDSFRKSPIGNLADRVRVQIRNADQYADFITKHMARAL